MKRWIHESIDTDNLNGYEHCIIVFDVVIRDVQTNAQALQVAASKQSSYITEIIKNPNKFLSDFSRVIINQGFNLKGKPQKSRGQDPNSISCYFYAEMTAKFNNQAAKLDLDAIFCIRTADHELPLAELRNVVQENWVKNNKTDSTHPKVIMIRVLVTGNKTYSEYFNSCKDVFESICEYKRNFGTWPANIVKEITV